MKKIFYSIIFISFFIIGSRNLAHAESFKFFNALTNSTDILADKVKSVNRNTYCFEKNNILYFHDERDYFVNEGSLIKTAFDDKYIYIIGSYNDQSMLFIVDKETKKNEKIILSCATVCDIYVNDYIYIVGGSLGDAYISKYDKSGLLIETKNYGGGGNEIFTSIRGYGEYLYISGEKDALSPNSCFGNLGNKGEKKALLVCMNKELKIEKQFYINNHDSKEVISSFLIKDEVISFILKTNTQLLHYKLDNELELLECFNLPTNYDNCVELPCPGEQDGNLYLLQRNTSLLLVFYQNNKKVCEEVVANNVTVDDYNIEKGHLYLYGINDEIIITDITQFTIIKNEPVYCTKAYYENINNYHFEYYSLFEKLSFTLESVSPYYEKTKCGTYDAIYIAEHQDGTITRITSKIIIDNFINIIDQGIYKEGYVLEFFGSAKLDGRTIYYGEELRGEGNHVLEITDINNKTDIYHFYVYNDYPKVIEYMHVSNSINVSENNPGKLELILNQNIDVKNIYVNNQEYYDFNVDENIITITFNYDEKNLIKNYYINKIITNDNKEILVNKNITVKGVKEPPLINLTKKVNDKKLNISCNIEDVDNTFVYLLVNLYKNEELVKTNLVYNNQNIVGNENKAYNYLEVFFCYELGDGTIYKKEVASASFNCNYEEKLQIDYSYDELKLSNIDISLAFPKELSNIKQIKVAGNELDNLNIYKSNTTFNTVIYASTMITLVIFILTILLLRRKYKNKIRIY